MSFINEILKYNETTMIRQNPLIAPPIFRGKLDQTLKRALLQPRLFLPRKRSTVRLELTASRACTYLGGARGSTQGVSPGLAALQTEFVTVRNLSTRSRWQQGIQQRFDSMFFIRSRVSIQGVESLWSDCRFIPADWGS